MTQNTGPLSGIKVVTCSTAQAGTVPYMFMADLGAHVIKIETPEKGDNNRYSGEMIGSFSSFFETNNRGVKSLTLNLKSDEGKAILHNPNVCLSFFWAAAERQIIIKGKAEKIPENLSDGYFETRPRGSQLGAIASSQSEVVKDRAELENKLKVLENKFEGKNIERPKHWGGLIVKPVELEFWQGRPNRLHDRIRYKLEEDYSWKVERLSP